MLNHPIRFIYIPAFVWLLCSGSILLFVLVLCHNEVVKSRLRSWWGSIILVYDRITWWSWNCVLGKCACICNEEADSDEDISKDSNRVQT